MHTTPVRSAAPHAAPQAPTAAHAVRSLARQLHRAAQAGSLATSLPVLRRVLAAGALGGLTLPQLGRQRHLIQRKHLLRMLAVEAGFATWEAYSHALKSMHAAELPHFDVLRHQAGHLNLWFSSREQAQAHAAAHGGRVVGVGGQAVVLPDEASP